jgi:integrase
MSVHKYKTLRGEVRWQARWRDRVSGRQHKDGGHRTKREAEAAERTHSRRGGYAAGRTSFDEYADRYLAQGQWKPKTTEGYTSALQHARRYFGATPVGEIRVPDCRAFMTWLASDECPGLRTPRSVNGAFAAFSSVLSLAVEDEALSTNPAAVVRPHRQPGARKFEPAFLDQEQVARICAELPDPYAMAVRFLAYTGLRAGELAALRIEDVDLTREVVRVHSSARKRGGQWERSTPKSRNSSREVKLLRWLAEDVGNYLARTHKGPWVESAPLFPNPAIGRREPGAPIRWDWSAPIEPQNFYRNHFVPAVRRAGLASLMLTAGMTPYWISRQMGHSSYVITLTTYAKLIEEQDAAHPAEDALPRPPEVPTADVIELERKRA